MDADGSNLSLIADDPSMCQGDPSFTPDGSRIVFKHFDWLGTGLDEVWSMRPGRSDKRLATGAGHVDPNVSPDGRRLSFKGLGVGALFVQNMDGTGLVQVSPTVSVANKHDWAPDGQRLVYSEISEPGPTDTVNIATVRPDGTDLRFLTHYPAPLRAWVGGYSPDGQWIVFRLEDHGPPHPVSDPPRRDGPARNPPASTSFVPRNIDWGPAVR